MKRTFIAIDIPLKSTVVEHIRRLEVELANESIKWIKPHQYHITIQFLGSVEDSVLDSINISLNKVAGNFSGFSLELAEFGVFKNLRNPRILWIGFRPCQELEQLKYAIEDEMIKFGFEKSDIPFAPHLTIGRVKFLKDKQKLEKLIDEYKGMVFQELEIKEIILYESILSPKGPEYMVIKKHSLR